MPVEQQDAKSGRYSLIARTLIFLTHENQVLLLRGAPHKRLWSNLYNGIGGHIERGEDLLSAARRELREETGLEPKLLWLCGTVFIDTGDTPGILIFVLKGECQLGQPRPSEEGTLAWVPQDQIMQLPLVEDLPILLPRVLAHTQQMNPFSARYWYDLDGKLQIQFAD